MAVPRALEHTGVTRRPSYLRDHQPEALAAREVPGRPATLREYPQNNGLWHWHSVVILPCVENAGKQESRAQEASQVVLGAEIFVRGLDTFTPQSCQL